MPLSVRMYNYSSILVITCINVKLNGFFTLNNLKQTLRQQKADL